MGENEPHTDRAISRLAESSEDAMRSLVALPLRMLAGTLGIFEALLRTAADAVGEAHPIDERVLDLEKRVESLEGQATGHRGASSATSSPRKRTRTGPDTAAEQHGP